MTAAGGAVWRVSSVARRVNDMGTVPDGEVRTVRVAHLVRGGHTACGRTTTAFTWVDDLAASAPRCRFCTGVGERAATHRDVCDTAGITYRQLDHWCRKGWLHPDPGAAGSGSRRTFPDGEVAVAARMGVLTRGGLAASAAARVAREQPAEPRDLTVAWAVGRGECA